MSGLSHQDITVILLGLGTLLAAARIFGELANRLGQPMVIGEIIAGIILGPTVLGHFMPEVTAYLFPASGPPASVLSGITTVAVVLFLLVAGIEVDLSTIFRQGRVAMTVSLAGIVVPFAMGIAAGWIAPDLLGREPEAPHHIFAMFFATALAISALPVIAKTLMDLNLYRTDLGMTVIAAAIFDDLAGWIIFAMVLGMMAPEAAPHLPIGGTIGLTILFVLVMLTAGRWLINWVLPWVQARTTWPGGVLGFAMVLALGSAAFTEWIGIHAVFGSFIAGVALGDSPHLRERTRATIEQFVSFIFAPLFFASIGLHINFAADFDLLLVILVLLIAMTSKVLGCGLGARYAGMPWREAWAVGFGMNARGAMGIILGLLAFDANVIGNRMFVALVVMAIVTSMISGSLMSTILRRKAPRRFIDYLHPKGFVNALQAETREQGIRELAQAAAAVTGLKPEGIEAAVLHRERMMPTGIGLCVAVPHARLEGLHKPIVCLGLSRAGLEFDAPDGERARMVFLILTPAEDEEGAQLEILADVSRTFLNESVRNAALRVSSYTEFVAVLKTREPGTASAAVRG